MIYFCIPSRNEAATVGLALWKIRQVLEGSTREYQLLVGDDGSDDSTAEVLDSYLKVLPLTVFRSEQPQGYAATVEQLLKEALALSDRHKRDAAIIWPADFTVDPSVLDGFLRKLDSGADLVVGEVTVEGEPDRWRKRVREWAPKILGGRASVPQVRDVVSGIAAVRLIALRQAFQSRPDRWLRTEGWAANAELLKWTAAAARRVETLPVVERADLRQRPSRIEPWPMVKELWSARRQLEAPPTGRQPSSD